MMYEYSGNMHMHTPYSDGTKLHDAIAQDALAAGLDFIIVTDHNVWVDGIERYYETENGRLLLLVGEEVHHVRRKPQANHFLVYGADQEMSSYAAKPQELIDKTREVGAYGFLAHPHENNLPLFNEGEYSWHSWYVERFHGLEIWNYMSSFKNEMNRALKKDNYALLKGYWTAIQFILNPDKFILGPEPATLAKWDELLTRGEQIAAVGNSDAHAITYSLGPISRKVLPYKFLFEAVNTHIILDKPLTGNLEEDKPRILKAIGEGHGWVGYDLIYPTKGFRFTAQSGTRGTMGDTVSMGVGATLQISAPTSCYMRIIYQGEVVAESVDTNLTYIPVDAGAYRAECYLMHKGKERGWIFSNPIYLK